MLLPDLIKRLTTIQYQLVNCKMDPWRIKDAVLCCFLLTLIWTITPKVSSVFQSLRFKTKNWDHKSVRKVFTEIKGQGSFRKFFIDFWTVWLFNMRSCLLPKVGRAVNKGTVSLWTPSLYCVGYKCLWNIAKHTRSSLKLEGRFSYLWCCWVCQCISSF